MRLDKYLKVSCLIKRRTVANEACDAGRVMVNSRVAKSIPGCKKSVISLKSHLETNLSEQKFWL